jgi:CpeS-like protein
MLTFQDFFTACTGLWTTERTYHYLDNNELERSYTEYQVDGLSDAEKRRILATCLPQGAMAQCYETDCPGFAIAFDTVSETGDRKTMSLKALFVLDAWVPDLVVPDELPLPIAAQGPSITDNDEVQRGYYLRDEGYSEAGAIAGRFTYYATRRILEMTTVYARSVAVDQMRLISPDTRLRTIVTYQKPVNIEPPSVINLIGFGVERKQIRAA